MRNEMVEYHVIYIPSCKPILSIPITPTCEESSGQGYSTKFIKAMLSCIGLPGWNTYKEDVRKTIENDNIPELLEEYHQGLQSLFRKYRELKNWLTFFAEENK